MSRARALRKARAEGKLTGEWEAMLDDLLGIDGQQRYEREAEGDGQALADEWADEGDFDVYVNPDTGDATFSLKAHQKTGLKEVIASANAAGNARSWAELPLPQDQRLAVESETGGSLQDFIRAVDTFGIRHASSRHGEESKDPHPITQADLLALPEILEAPGVMGLSPESGKNVSSVVHVRFHHDWYYYIEEVRTGSKALVFNTLRKSPGKAASSQTNSAEAGSYTSETILAEAKERLARALADYKQKHSGTHSLRAIPPG